MRPRFIWPVTTLLSYLRLTSHLWLFISGFHVIEVFLVNPWHWATMLFSGAIKSPRLSLPFKVNQVLAILV